MKATTTCPRCGKAAIEVKDWGQAGKLFVHSHGFEEFKVGKKVERIPVQDACRVTRTELEKGLAWTRAQPC